jgi:putative ABC transport system substrate-binding protein
LVGPCQAYGCPQRLRHLLLPLLILASFAWPAGAVAAKNVAVIMSADVDAYREALRGFKGKLEFPAIIAEYNMEGYFDRGRKILTEIQTKVKPDLIVAIGTLALQVVAGQVTDIPVVYAMVLNPPNIVGVGAKNITGASMNVPVEEPILLFKQLGPQIRRVGILFNQTNTGYLVRQADAVARAEGLQLIAKMVRSSKEAIEALDSLQQGEIDVLWILPDETVIAPEVVERMLLFSYRRKVPLLGLSNRQAEMGALFSLSFASSEDIGRQAGELANSIVQGKRVAEVPYTTARRVTLSTNLKAAQKLGIEIPKSILARADTVIPADVGISPDWMKFDPQKQEVDLLLVGAADASHGTMNFNGYGHGEMTIIIPFGWKVKVTFRNKGLGAIPHSLAVVNEAIAMPVQGGTLAFPRATTVKLVPGLLAGEEDSFQFVANTEGRFLLFCGVTGHGVQGMWDYLIVSKEAKLPSVLVSRTAVAGPRQLKK